MKLKLLVLILPYLTVWAQPKLTIDFPVKGDTNISLIPEMKIKINPPYEIDKSCLNRSEYYQDNWDSVKNRLIYAEITFFPTVDYIGTDSSLKRALDYGIWTKSLLYNDSILSILPLWSLEYLKEYGIFFDDFRVYNHQTNDTLVFDTLICPLFTTAQPMFSVKGLSPYFGVIRVADTVIVYFNRKLSSDITPSGPLLSLQEVVEIQSGDSTIYNFIDKHHKTWLNNDKKSISILPDTNYEQGKEYLVRIHLFRLTGDSTDDYCYLLRVRESAIVEVKSRCNDPNDTLPEHCGPLCGNRMFFIGANEEFHIECTDYYDGFFFVGWECKQTDTIHGNWNNEIVINFEAKDLMDLDITAVWARIINDEIIIHSSKGGSCKVYTTGVQLNDSTYTFPRREGDWIAIDPEPDDMYGLHKWLSNDSTINGSKESYLRLRALVDKIENIETKGKPPWLPSDYCFKKKILELTPVFFHY